MNHPTSKKRQERWLGIVTIASFVTMWALFFVALNAVTVVAWWVAYAGFALPTTEQFIALTSEEIPSWLIAGTSALQFGCMLLFTVGGAWLVARVRRHRMPQRVGAPDTVWSQLANRPSPSVVWLAALGGGLTIGWFPAWLSAQIKTWFPMLDLGAVASVGSVLHDGDAGSRFTLMLVIMIVAPICEELLFRGWLWSALERWMSPYAVILATSVLFAAFHLDPAQGIPLVVTGCFFGWLRYTSNAVGPSIAAHMTNNTLAVYLMVQPYPPAVDNAFLITTIVVTLAMVMATYRALLDRQFLNLPKSIY